MVSRALNLIRGIKEPELSPEEKFKAIIKRIDEIRGRDNEIDPSYYSETLLDIIDLTSIKDSDKIRYLGYVTGFIESLAEKRYKDAK